MADMISVVIPIYNSQQYLDKCLESVCRNSYRDLEIILVDDGSTDQSGLICETFAREDPRLKVFHQNNTGVSGARNLGLSVAGGKYIAFIDSDDIVEMDYFEELFKTITENTCDLAIGSIAHIREDTTDFLKPDDCTVRLIAPSKEDQVAFCELNRFFLLYGPVNKLYKRSIITENRITFPIDTSYGEDLIFNFDYLMHCSKISYRKQPVYYYNHNIENSLSRKYRADFFENGLRLNEKIRHFCEEKNFFTEEMQKYWASRIFDDAYNSLFDIWNKQCDLTICGKYWRTKQIMNHPSTRYEYRNCPQDGYLRVYKNMIRNKQALLFSLIRCLASLWP